MFAEKKNVVGREFKFIFVQEFFDFLVSVVGKFRSDAVGCDGMNVFGDIDKGVEINSYGDFIFTVVVGNGSDETLHVLKEHVDFSIFFGDGSGDDAYSVAFFELRHEFSLPLVAATVLTMIESFHKVEEVGDLFGLGNFTANDFDSVTEGEF